jgi:arabinogalactan endo-1,4-beta-galactosidase
MAENGARPDFVQIGNEVSYGMLWRTAADRCYSSSAPSVWLRFTGLLSAAAKAVREAAPEAKIVLHTERSGNAEQARSFYQQIDRNGVDYDIIGLSYYPFWHGTLDDLSVTLNTLEQDFPSKPVYIVETAYYYKDFSSVEGIIYDTSSTWPATAEGQRTFILDLCRELASHKNVEGLYYWFPEENGSGGANYNEANVVLRTWQNRGLWDNTTHKLNPGLLTLKEFITAKEAIITPPDPPKPTLGDIDGDGQITVSDITRLIDIYLGLE